MITGPTDSMTKMDADTGDTRPGGPLDASPIPDLCSGCGRLRHALGADIGPRERHALAAASVRRHQVALARAGEAAIEGLAQRIDALVPVANEFARAVSTSLASVGKVFNDPELRRTAVMVGALDARRHRNTGPEPRRPRTPRHLSR